MMRKRQGFMRVLLFVAVSIITGCDNSEQAFKSSELIISASDFQEKLNTHDFRLPFSVQSSDERVAVAEFSGTDILIRSTGSGSATIKLRDYRCESNDARIDITVDETGAIMEPVMNPFGGSLVKAVIKEPVSILGTIGNAITPVNINLMLDNTDFVAVKVGDDCSGWIDNLPQGLKAEIVYVQGGEHIHEVTLEVSGEPGKSSAEIVHIIIPPEHIVMHLAVQVDPRQDARFAIS
jgi:hypothetical protein